VEYLVLTSENITKVTSGDLEELIVEVKDGENKVKEALGELGLENDDPNKIELSWLKNQNIMDEHELVRNMSMEFKTNLSETKKMVEEFPREYLIDGNDISNTVKTLRKYRRTLKGENKIELTKGIDTLITAYSSHLDDCIKSIYWLNKYETPLRKMNFTEQDLKKIHSIKDYDTRIGLVDILCKFWEADLELKELNYCKDYSNLHKERGVSKREFKKYLKNITHQSIRKNVSDSMNDFIVKSVCNSPGISARQLHERMDNKLYKRASPQIISKAADKLGITNVDGSYYKLNSDIKKDLYAYTASFIDSDGYITIDKSHNPRVGLVATGDRGKAFMIQIQKELGVGKLHLDQKSPQNTRPVNRLNFYSQADVTELLTKCRPYFRMKGTNADLLLELIRMKKSYKKADWYKNRCDEIFKLMKYENHKDHVNYDFSKYDVDIETVAKLHDNCKTSIMDDLESIIKEDSLGSVTEYHGTLNLKKVLKEGINGSNTNTRSKKWIPKKLRKSKKITYTTDNKKEAYLFAKMRAKDLGINEKNIGVIGVKGAKLSKPEILKDDTFDGIVYVREGGIDNKYLVKL
tara:strand:+ start:3688 stop:5421 length:1734 start_codon:yes stop_codon:yes gene_type:complete